MPIVVVPVLLASVLNDAVLQEVVRIYATVCELNPAPVVGGRAGRIPITVGIPAVRVVCE